MEDRYLCKAKRTDNGKWIIGGLVRYGFAGREKYYIVPNYASDSYALEIDPSTICWYTGLKDKNGRLIWENDILMCHGNAEDLVKAAFGEFNIINAETLEVVDRVIGWHYEVVPTDALSKCEPFCLSMPLTEEYVKACEFEVVGSVFDNPGLFK